MKDIEGTASAEKAKEPVDTRALLYHRMLQIKEKYYRKPIYICFSECAPEKVSYLPITKDGEDKEVIVWVLPLQWRYEIRKDMTLAIEECRFRSLFGIPIIEPSYLAALLVPDPYLGSIKFAEVDE